MPVSTKEVKVNETAAPVLESSLFDLLSSALQVGDHP
jgi:hypothetical protein